MRPERTESFPGGDDHARAFRSLCDRLNLVLVFDHVGRAGNGFLLGIFDQHPQVVSSHWVHYIYSYLVTEYGLEQELDSEAAHDFILNQSYFQFVFRDADDYIRANIHKMGGDPDTPIDRPLCRRVFRELVTARPRIRRRELVVAAYYAMAAGMGRDVSRARYLLIADAVSLRDEHVMQGFSGRALDAALADFPDLKPVSLVRDPRAMFASNRHQFVNALGNMYCVAPGSTLRQLHRLLTDDLRPDTTVWPYWLAYGAQTARCIYALRRRLADRFRVLRNEDLNLHFLPTMTLVAEWLGIDMLPQWREPDYVPTSMGRPWKGTGAYNSRYQKVTDGLLKNDPQSVAERSAGPNRHVTVRWRQKLAPHEIRLIELLFREEMEDLGYEAVQGPDACRASLASCLARPFRGELPSAGWIAGGFSGSTGQGLRRLFYLIALPPFYVVSRLRMLRLASGGFFDGISGGEVQAPVSRFLSPVHKAEA